MGHLPLRGPMPKRNQKEQKGTKKEQIDAEALVVIGTLMPHLRGVVRGRGGERRGVGHRPPEGQMPHVPTTCTSFCYMGQEG